MNLPVSIPVIVTPLYMLDAGMGACVWSLEGRLLGVTRRLA